MDKVRKLQEAGRGRGNSGTPFIGAGLLLGIRAEYQTSRVAKAPTPNVCVNWHAVSWSCAICLLSCKFRQSRLPPFSCPNTTRNFASKQMLQDRLLQKYFSKWTVSAASWGKSWGHQSMHPFTRHELSRIPTAYFGVLAMLKGEANNKNIERQDWNWAWTSYIPRNLPHTIQTPNLDSSQDQCINNTKLLFWSSFVRFGSNMEERRMRR